MHCVCVCVVQEYCNEKRANVGISMISGLCFLVNVPHFWSFTVDWSQGQGAGAANGTTGGPALVKTDFQKGEGGMRYEFWVHCIFLVLVPWFSVFTLNLLIISRVTSSFSVWSVSSSIFLSSSRVTSSFSVWSVSSSTSSSSPG